MASAWQWPVDPTLYDRSALLSTDEQHEVAYLAGRHGREGHWPAQVQRGLGRLVRPVMDGFAVTGTAAGIRSAALTTLAAEMQQRQRTFWAWTPPERLETFGTSSTAFAQRHRKPRACRSHLIALSYLLQCFQDVAALESLDHLAVARRVFGRARVDWAVQRVVTLVTSWGYGASRAEHEMCACVCLTLLANRRPHLEEVTTELLDELRHGPVSRHRRASFMVLSHALCGLGITTRKLDHTYFDGAQANQPDPTEGIAPEWVAWAQRWRATSTIGPTTRRGYYLLILQAGRWVTHTHPELTSPAQWTRDVAAEYVAAVDRMTIGQWAHQTLLSAARVGQPLSAKSKTHHLAAIRAFFRDCHEWGWMARRLDPRRSFAAPRSLLARITPNPRVIADDAWAKLLWAGLNLVQEDLPATFRTPHQHYYPLAMVRALALVWLFAGLRANEIARLRVGCIRWQRTDITLPGTDDVLPQDAVCLLDVPVHKTGAAFTKPVDVAVGTAITTWEKVRPEQPAALDSKTGEVVQYLFAYRGEQFSAEYLNRTLIPLLCRKGGVPTDDARGKITSHRARSTIASQLFNAKEPMSLFELQEWLGHGSPASTQHYAKITPTKLAKSYANSGYFGRNVRIVEVLIDQEAITNGAATRGEPWKFYDLGHGYCTYDFFDQCPHRMACAKCSFYRPKGSSQAQLLEAQANLQRMLQELPLTEEERAAVDDGLGAMDKLCAQLADVPTPAGPTPRQLGPARGIPVPMAPPQQTAQT